MCCRSAKQLYKQRHPEVALFVFGHAMTITASTDDYKTATLLGVVQGLGEFLPISSAGHLIVVPWLFGLEELALNSLAYDVALHIGTTTALLGYVWRDWLGLVQAAPHPRTQQGRLFWLIAVASVPGAVAGYLLDDLVSTTLRSPPLVAASLAGMGVVLFGADHYGHHNRSLAQFRVGDALAVGLAQAVALIPGVSRSGATIAMARSLGFERETAARFSFLMAVPITTGALVYKLKGLDAAAITGPFVTGIVVSGVTGAVAIRVLLKAIGMGSRGFLPFVIYRLLIALLVIVLYLRRQR